MLGETVESLCPTPHKLTRKQSLPPLQDRKLTRAKSAHCFQGKHGASLGVDNLPRYTQQYYTAFIIVRYLVSACVDK